MSGGLIHTGEDDSSNSGGITYDDSGGDSGGSVLTPVDDSGEPSSSGEIIVDDGGGDSSSSGGSGSHSGISEDEIITLNTKIKYIKMEEVELDNLLFAIGDNFAFTDNGVLFSKEIRSQNGIFKNICGENFSVNQNAYIGKNLTIDGDLVVKGRIYSEGSITTEDWVETGSSIWIGGDINMKDSGAVLHVADRNIVMRNIQS